MPAPRAKSQGSLDCQEAVLIGHNALQDLRKQLHKHGEQMRLHGKHKRDDEDIGLAAELPAISAFLDNQGGAHYSSTDTDDDTTEGCHHGKKVRHGTKPQDKTSKIPWTNTEDLTILALNLHLGSNWGTIASQLPGRTADAVRNRCFRLKSGPTPHPYSPDNEEGRAKLAAFIEQCNIVIPSFTAETGTRDTPATHATHAPRQQWTAEEDRVILEQVAIHGKQWREVAKALPGRTDSSIRNRYERALKEPKLGAPPNSRTSIAAAAPQSARSQVLATASAPHASPQTTAESGPTGSQNRNQAGTLSVPLSLAPIRESPSGGEPAVLAALSAADASAACDDSPSSVAPEINHPLSAGRSTKIRHLHAMGSSGRQLLFERRSSSFGTSTVPDSGREEEDDDDLQELSAKMSDCCRKELAVAMNALMKPDGTVDEEQLPIGLASPEVMVDISEFKQAVEDAIEDLIEDSSPRRTPLAVWNEEDDFLLLQEESPMKRSGPFRSLVMPSGRDEASFDDLCCTRVAVEDSFVTDEQTVRLRSSRASMLTDSAPDHAAPLGVRVASATLVLVTAATVALFALGSRVLRPKA